MHAAWIELMKSLQVRRLFEYETLLGSKIQLNNLQTNDQKWKQSLIYIISKIRVENYKFALKIRYLHEILTMELNF